MAGSRTQKKHRKRRTSKKTCQSGGKEPDATYTFDQVDKMIPSDYATIGNELVNANPTTVRETNFPFGHRSAISDTETDAQPMTVKNNYGFIPVDGTDTQVAILTFYTTSPCGTCSFIQHNVIPQIIDLYTTKWQAAKKVYNARFETGSADSNNLVPPIIKVQIESVPEVGPGYTPSEVTKLPSIALTYYNIDMDNTIISKVLTKVIYEYDDWVAKASKNTLWVNYGYSTRLANQLFFVDFRDVLYDIYPSYNDFFDLLFVI